MVSDRAREIGRKIYSHLKKDNPSINMDDLKQINEIVDKFNDITDDDYLGIVIGMEFAYEEKSAETFRDRFYYAYGYNEYFDKVKDGSLDSDDRRLHSLDLRDRYYAALGFLKGHEELRKGMISDGLIKEKTNTKK